MNDDEITSLDYNFMYIGLDANLAGVRVGDWVRNVSSYHTNICAEVLGIRLYADGEYVFHIDERLGSHDTSMISGRCVERVDISNPIEFNNVVLPI